MNAFENIKLLEVCTLVPFAKSFRIEVQSSKHIKQPNIHFLSCVGEGWYVGLKKVN